VRKGEKLQHNIGQSIIVIANFLNYVRGKVDRKFFIYFITQREFT
jgi:hypothetical protein